jgi:arylsulfatase A-like enzyme
MHPYRSALRATVGSALVAGLLVGVGDVVLTALGSGASGGDVGQLALLALTLYATFAVVVGGLEGIVAGAILAGAPDATPGSLWRKLSSDVELDRRATAALLAALVAMAVYAVVVAVLAVKLVANVERKTVGALLLGGAAAVMIPVVALAAVVPYRLTRRLVGVVPRLGSFPRFGLTVVLVKLVGIAAVALYVTQALDWRALPLGVPLALIAFVAVQLLWLALAPRLGWVLPLALVALVAGPLAVSVVSPSERAALLLNNESHGAKALAAVARQLADRDKDGYAAILGGGDCDNARADVHPGATDTPDDGIDQNCVGGDATQKAGVAPPPDEPARPDSAAAKLKWEGNVVIIAVDTLRVDRLGVSGYTRRGGKSLTPRIDKLAAESIRFEKVWAQSPNTPRSFPSLFTSRYPSQVKWDKQFANYPVVLPENTTVFEALKAAGVLAYGVTSHFYFTEERGITQGFESFDNEGATNLKDSNKDIASPRTVPRVNAKLKELAGKGGRFVLFTHLFEPHSTYMEHPEFPIQSTGVAGLEEKYDYEIAFVDRYVGEILDGIEAAGIADKTVVVLVSDHGEAFGVHRFAGQRMFFHGQTLYDELLRVPLIVKVPGQQPRVVATPTMLIDVAPTLLDLYKVPRPADFVGRSLLPALVGEELPPRPVHAELLPAPSWDHAARMRVLADGKTKLFYRVSDNAFERYDLSTDPEERTDLWGKDAAADQAAKTELVEWMESGR